MIRTIMKKVEKMIEEVGVIMEVAKAVMWNIRYVVFWVMCPTLIGTFIGCCVALFCLFCFKIEEWIGIMILIICTVVGFCIGCHIIISEIRNKREERLQKKQKEKELLEQEKQEEAEQKFNSWCRSLEKAYSEILTKLVNCPEKITGYEYEKILNMKVPTIEDRYKNYYSSEKHKHKMAIRNGIVNRFSQGSVKKLKFGISAIKCLKALDNRNDVQFDKTIQAIEKVYMDCQKPLIYIKSLGYGEFELPFENQKEYEYLEKHAEEITNQFYKRVLTRQAIESRADKYFSCIHEGFRDDYIETACTLLWYYAGKKPFDTKQFNQVEEAFNQYTKSITSLKECKYKDSALFNMHRIESVLARIYFKNQMGGIATVNQEMEYVNMWLKIHLEEANHDICCLFASGLAWMELYSLELEVLRKCVEYNIQLPAELQERLSFLESGGTSNVKVYKPESTNEFLYDSAAVDWTQKEFEVLFRKATMKKLELNYAFAITNWTKTLPLAEGQKVSADALYHEFEKMVADFDGEVVCQKVLARAINLENVEHENAVLFTFRNKRNRCGSMLFSSEKFGRNLNLTIITMFTPESGLSNEEQIKYVQALNGNIYIDSFRESILQAVDRVLKERKTVYDDEEVIHSKYIVE